MTTGAHAHVVLIVEDEPFIRRLSAFELEDAGYEVLQASCAHEALELLSTERQIGLLITDVNMPGGLSGLELAQKVRNRWPHLHLIVTTGAGYIRPSDLPPEVRILLKPYSLESLTRVVGHLFGLSQHSPP